jgi:hypothetical protein
MCITSLYVVDALGNWILYLSPMCAMFFVPRNAGESSVLGIVGRCQHWLWSASESGSAACACTSRRNCAHVGRNVTLPMPDDCTRPLRSSKPYVPGSSVAASSTPSRCSAARCTRFDALNARSHSENGPTRKLCSSLA